MKYDFSGTPGDYQYDRTQYGKSVAGVVKVGAQSQRDPALQRSVGGQDREPGDHGGHLMAHSLGGRNDESNLDPQNANVNQIGQRSVEREVAQLAQDPNNQVYMEVSNYSGSGSQRPDATMITVAVRNATTGQVDVEHYSFQNASYAEQEQWDQMAAEVAQIDPRQDAGLTPEQRDLANQLSETEKYDGGQLGTGFTMDFTQAQNDGSSLTQESQAEQTAYDGGDAAMASDTPAQGYDGGGLENDASAAQTSEAEQDGGYDGGQDGGYDGGYDP